MRVSVIICTWNRASELRSTLQHLTKLVIPEHVSWELLVVNNACSDETEYVLDEFGLRLPLRRLFEPILGLSRARNRAAAEATGELLLFTDDDVCVNPHWLAAHVAAAERWPDAAFFGGSIQPQFDGPPPRWVHEQRSQLTGLLALRDLGTTERLFSAEEYPFGPNLALRADAFRHACFDEKLGRKGKEQVRGSERSILAVLKQLGLQGVWVPGARVRHRVPRSRMSLRYFWKSYQGRGRERGRRGRPLERRALLHALHETAVALMRLGQGRTDWVRPLQTAALISGQLRETRWPRLKGAKR